MRVLLSLWICSEATGPRAARNRFGLISMLTIKECTQVWNVVADRRLHQKSAFQNCGINRSATSEEVASEGAWQRLRVSGFATQSRGMWKHGESPKFPQVPEGRTGGVTYWW